MSIPRIGQYVIHAKMPALGVGEILDFDGDRVAIRFACGEKQFVDALVTPHLSVTTEAPPPRRGKRVMRAKKPGAIKPVSKAAAAKLAAADKAAAAGKAVPEKVAAPKAASAKAKKLLP